SNNRPGIDQVEAHRQAVVNAFHRPGYHHTTNSQALTDLGFHALFAFYQLGWGVEQINVLPQGIEHQTNSTTDHQDHCAKGHQPLFTSWIHQSTSSASLEFCCWRARLAAIRCCLACSACQVVCRLRRALTLCTINSSKAKPLTPNASQT